MSALESIALRINTFIFQPPLRADLYGNKGGVRRMGKRGVRKGGRVLEKITSLRS
jgi:hypothetical protein